MGMSNGGMMSERLGCERPDLFRAIASVTGATVERPAGATWINSSLSLSACDSAYAAATGKQSRPFSVLHVHGTADATVQWTGGGPLDWPTVPANMAAWAGRLRCNATDVNQTLNMGNFTNQLWSDCGYAGGQVELVRVEGWDAHVVRGAEHVQLDRLCARILPEAEAGTRRRGRWWRWR